MTSNLEFKEQGDVTHHNTDQGFTLLCKHGHHKCFKMWIKTHRKYDTYVKWTKFVNEKQIEWICATTMWSQHVLINGSSLNWRTEMIRFIIICNHVYIYILRLINRNTHYISTFISGANVSTNNNMCYFTLRKYYPKFGCQPIGTHKCGVSLVFEPNVNPPLM